MSLSAASRYKKTLAGSASFKYRLQAFIGYDPSVPAATSDAFPSIKLSASSCASGCLKYFLGLFPILLWIRYYNFEWLACDLIAGLTIGLALEHELRQNRDASSRKWIILGIYRLCYLHRLRNFQKTSEWARFRSSRFKCPKLLPTLRLTVEADIQRLSSRPLWRSCAESFYSRWASSVSERSSNLSRSRPFPYSAREEPSLLLPASSPAIWLLLSTEHPGPNLRSLHQ